MRRFAAIAMVVALAMSFAVPALADPGQPSFAPEVYADGDVFGTKAATALPAPKGNEQSFDKLFVIVNSNNPAGQLPVAEAAPGPGYNGGRWATQTVEWTEAGFADHGMVPVLTSYDEVMVHYSLGHLDITPGSPGGPGAPPDYFLCPLLPVK